MVALWGIWLKLCSGYPGSSSFMGTQLHFSPLSSMRILKALLGFSDSQPLFSALFPAWVLSFSVHSFQTGRCLKSKKCDHMSGSSLSVNSPKSWPLKIGDLVNFHCDQKMCFFFNVLIIFYSCSQCDGYSETSWFVIDRSKNWFILIKCHSGYWVQS